MYISHRAAFMAKILRVRVYDPDTGTNIQTDDLRCLVKKKPQVVLKVQHGMQPDSRRDGDLVEVKTVYDLVTMVIFAGLVVLFLQRSTAAEPRDHMYQYAPPAIGCAVANYLGNHGQDWVAVTIIVAVVLYVLYVLKPFNQTL
jgi:hypothetical protein